MEIFWLIVAMSGYIIAVVGALNRIALMLERIEKKL